MLLPSNPSCALVQMNARTIRDAPAHRRMSRTALGALPMARIASVPQVVTAMLNEVPANAVESAQVQLVRSGSLILEQGGRQTRFDAGEVAVYDVSEPFEFIYPAEFSTIIVQVPSADLGLRRGVGSLTVRPGTPRSAGRDMLTSLLRSTDAHVDSLSENGRSALSRAIVDSVRLFARDAAGPPREHGSARVALARRAREHVAVHATDVTLSASRIATDLHVSVRTLHAAFEEERETLGQVIRSVRVDRARMLLHTTPGSIGEVAEGVGYADVTSFIRVFKAAEGVTPAVWRRRQQKVGA